MGCRRSHNRGSGHASQMVSTGSCLLKSCGNFALSPGMATCRLTSQGPTSWIIRLMAGVSQAVDYRLCQLAGGLPYPKLTRRGFAARVDLTEEDESILDRVWDRIAAEETDGNRNSTQRRLRTRHQDRSLGRSKARAARVPRHVASGIWWSLCGNWLRSGTSPSGSTIIPYQGPTTDHCWNGLLLRADIHNLFDLHLLGVDPPTFSIRIAPSLRDSSYGELEGRQLTAPLDVATLPNCEALRRHFDECQRNWLVSPSSA